MMPDLAWASYKFQNLLFEKVTSYILSIQQNIWHHSDSKNLIPEIFSFNSRYSFNLADYLATINLIDWHLYKGSGFWRLRPRLS